MPPMVFLYITNESLEAAQKLARHILEKRLIGCANMYPITAMYWWKGEIAEGGEYVLIAKTTEEKWKEARAEIEKVHPFETPCIVKLDADPNDKYLQWIQSELVKP